MAGKQIPSRSVALEDGAVFVSVREAARMLGLSPYTLYSYLARGKLTRQRIDGRIMLSENELLAWRERRQAPLPELANSSMLTIRVPVYPGCSSLLTERLASMREHNRHHFPGANAQYITRSVGNPERLMIILLWSATEHSSEQSCAQAIQCLRSDLEDVCDWSLACIHEGEVFSLPGKTDLNSSIPLAPT